MMRFIPFTGCAKKSLAQASTLETIDEFIPFLQRERPSLVPGDLFSLSCGLDCPVSGLKNVHMIMSRQGLASALDG